MANLVGFAYSTVAQSLRRIKKLKGQMAELQKRAESSVSYEAGKKPAFEFTTLRGDIAKVREELVTLRAAVDVANATAIITVDGMRLTVAEAITRLQETKAELAWLSSLALRAGTEREADVDYDADTGRQVRRTREVTYVSELTEPERVAELERLRDRFERFNDAVERSNHVTQAVWLVGDAPAQPSPA